MFEATTETVFSAAHALRLPDGQFEPLHGHDWRVAVTVGSETLDAMDTVMDFHALERMVEDVVGPWRNGNLNAVAPFAGTGGELAVNPSAERVAEHIARALKDRLRDTARLVEVAVGESPGCTARFRP